jgi:hypothetical protein
MQCPQCRRSFQTNNSTKKYCTADCQQRFKAETRAARVSQRDFRPSFQEQHRRNSGADAHSAGAAHQQPVRRDAGGGLAGGDRTASKLRHESEINSRHVRRASVSPP